jgi:hypothetical protein
MSACNFVWDVPPDIFLPGWRSDSLVCTESLLARHAEKEGLCVTIIDVVDL